MAALMHRKSILFISLVSAVPLFAVRFLPSFDYPFWLYQAHVIANFASFKEWYRYNIMLTPNLGSTVALLPLAPILGAELSGKLVVAAYVVSMTLAFGFMVRGIVGAPSGVELLGPILAYNYFLYEGNLSFVLGMPIVLAFIGFVSRNDQFLQRKQLFALALLSLLAYVFHLFAWVPILLYVIIVAAQTNFYSRTLVWTQAAPLLLLVTYATTRLAGGGVSVRYYESLPNKLFSLVGPNLPFSRVDPFVSPFPILLANLVTLGCIALLAFLGFRRERLGRVAQSVGVLGTALLVASAAVPVYGFGGMGALDQRLSFLAVLVLLPLLGMFTTTRIHRTVSMALSLAVVGGHYVGFRAVDAELSALYTGIQIRPAASSVFVASLRDPPIYGECEPKRWLNFGNSVFPVARFATYDAIDRGGVVASTWSTAALTEQPSARFTMVSQQFILDTEGNDLVSDILSYASSYDYLIVFGCPEHIDSVSQLWRDGHRLVGRGELYAVVELQHR